MARYPKTAVAWPVLEHESLQEDRAPTGRSTARPKNGLANLNLPNKQTNEPSTQVVFIANDRENFETFEVGLVTVRRLSLSRRHARTHIYTQTSTTERHMQVLLRCCTDEHRQASRTVYGINVAVDTLLTSGKSQEFI